MMKTHTTLIILLASILFTSSCRKGEKDPLFSFLTRKQRLSGDWTMREGTAAITYFDQGSPRNDNFAFDGSQYNLNRTETSGPPTIYIGGYLLSMQILKDGTFTLSENFQGRIFKASGSWDFTSGVGKGKKKESIVMVINSSTGDASDQHIFNKFSTEFTYRLVELKNKEIIIESATNVYIGANGDQTEYESSYRFTQE